MITAEENRQFAASQREKAERCSPGAERDQLLATAAKYEAIAEEMQGFPLSRLQR